MKPTYISVVALTLLFTAFLPTATFAQQTCTLTDIWYEGDPDTRTVDCADPFGVGDAPTGAAQLVVAGEIITEGAEVSLAPNSTLAVTLNPTPNTEHLNSTRLSLYRHDGTDYILDHTNFRTIVTPGTYTAVITESLLTVSQNDSFLHRLKSFFIPTAYAQSYEEATYLVTTVTFTVTIADEPQPPLSPLLLKYEPILRFHEDEDYFPMNVEAFVEGSGLWDSAGLDENIIPRSPVNVPNGLTLDYLATTTDTSNWYINFSSDEPATFNPAVAKSRYQALLQTGKAAPTYYAAQTEDSYTDQFDNTHSFTVLQYWYFYAMNNWGEHTEFGNNHEGDWESVFVFLDRETESPEYVAFSSHLNNGEPNNVWTFQSVRRTWDDAEKDQDKVNVYVSLGSHANYSQAGEYEGGRATDRATGGGLEYDTDYWLSKYLLQTNEPGWENNFEGLFGTQLNFTPGGSGTQGPLFTSVGGTQRFHNPIAWAGIDDVIKTRLTTDSMYEMRSIDVRLTFSDPVPTGADLITSLYKESIHFGKNKDEVKLLPRYWDFTIDIPNENFQATVDVFYSDEEMVETGLLENKLIILYYNEEEDQWQQVPSVLNTETNTITFSTNHFSIYTIGEWVDVEESNPEDETEDNNVQQSSGSQSTRTNRLQSTSELEATDTVMAELQAKVQDLEIGWRVGRISVEELLRGLLEILRLLSEMQTVD